MPYASSSAPVRAGHALVRGGRWHLARPRSRALWTAASPAELADLFRDAQLQRRLEDFLRLAASVVDDVGSLLLFDDECSDLEVSVALTDEPGGGCTWTWTARSFAEVAPAS